MANGHSRNKRGRGNPRARHGPPSQSRSNAKHATLPTTIPPSASPAPRAQDDAATPQTTALPPGELSPHSPSRTEPRGPSGTDGTDMPSPHHGGRPGSRPPREAGWSGAERGGRVKGANAAISANGASGAHGMNGANGGRGARSRGGPPLPAARSSERITSTEEASAPPAAPLPAPRPISREHGWRAQPPRLARPRDEPVIRATPPDLAAPSVDHAGADLAPSPSARAPWASEAEPEEHAELVVHTERSLQRPPSVIVAPNGHAPFRPEVRGALGPLIDDLHDLFARDRAIASQGGNARCGICYQHHPLSELDYHEAEGFYVCPACQQALGHTTINMVRRQQR